MRRQSKCCYCRKEGHKITHCYSEKGNTLFNNICSRAIDTIVLENRTIDERAQLFYKFLIDSLYVDELKLLLSKKLSLINGNKKELAARFVNIYFIRELAYGPYSRHMEHNERLYIAIYANYWRLLSGGILIDAAKQQLNSYLYLIKQVEPTHKFPINVVIKSVDLTEEEEQPAQSFECAICMEEECPILDQVELGCGHSFCVSCVSNVLTNSQNNKKHPCCGLCRADFKSTQVHTQKIMKYYNTRFCFAC